MANLLEGTIHLETLRRQIARLETGAKRHDSDPPVSSGCEALDGLLPERGFCRGTLVEWLSAGEGTGASTLALLAAEQACRDGRVLAVFDFRHGPVLPASKGTVPFSLTRKLGQSPGREFCPPAAVRLGIGPEQLLVVHADTAADNHWAIDQALRSPAVAALLAWPDRLDDRTFRRWQLSAEEGGCLAMLLRPEAARSEPSWADVRLLVEPLLVTTMLRNRKRLLRITLLRCRGGNSGRSLDVELDDETYRVHSVDQSRWRLAN